MDSIRNPFAPGAGTRPYALTGREDAISNVMTSVGRSAIGRSAKSHVLLGLRGVGKTVMLEEIRSQVESAGNIAVMIEAPERKSLPAVLIPELRLALTGLTRYAVAKDLTQRGLRALAGFASAMKVKYKDVELQLDIEPENGLADAGDLEHDLGVLFETIGVAVQRAGRVLVILIDELQYIQRAQLGPLIAALHRCAQRQLPVMSVGAGLPPLRGMLGNAKTYAERMFEFAELSSLPSKASEDAIRIPLHAEEVVIEDRALAAIIEDTQGYPYFLQEWGKHAWNCASQSPITHDDVVCARTFAQASLDVSFFGVRFDRVSDAERAFMIAMAELGDGPYQSAAIAIAMGKQPQEITSMRSRLIGKGMIWSPAYGVLDFTVPLFRRFLLRRVGYHRT